MLSIESNYSWNPSVVELELSNLPVDTVICSNVAF